MKIYQRKDGVVKKLKNNLVIITDSGKDILPKQPRHIVDEIKFCLSLDEVYQLVRR